jgi:hypothetical protein
LAASSRSSAVMMVIPLSCKTIPQANLTVLTTPLIKSGS